LAVQPHKRIDITTQAHRAPKIIRMRMLVPQFADAVLADAGAKIGVRSEIKCYTEFVFRNNGQSKIRPDGLVDMVEKGSDPFNLCRKAGECA
jgi:hypothetical protein